MSNGDDYRIMKRIAAGALALVAVGGLVGCTPSSQDEKPAAAASKAVVKHFGPAGWGKLTIGMAEPDALATGDLQTAPISTVLGENVYSFVGGPKPDPKRMAADEAIEKRVAQADKLPKDASAAESAKAAQAYADSAQRIADRMTAYLTAGGASFRAGSLTSIAAPKDATTESGVKRGSTLAEVKAAYQAQGLTNSSKSVYQLPVTGHDDWRLQFEFEGDTVAYLTLVKIK